jgi:hypothetical protein
LVDGIQKILPAIYCSQEIQIPTSIGILFLWKKYWNVWFPVVTIAVSIM